LFHSNLQPVAINMAELQLGASVFFHIKIVAHCKLH
jgi:hypothetical protein